jgi:hypothetical protein
MKTMTAAALTMVMPIMLVSLVAATELDEPVEDAPTASLHAEIVITGAELLPIEGGGDAAPQAMNNWLARLIDPTESVDEIPLPTGESGFSYTGTFCSPERIVAVMFDVPFDLSGGDAESTPVDVLIPVALNSADTTQLEAVVELVQFYDEWVVDLTYTAEQGETKRRHRCRLYWEEGRLAFDNDGDGLYETVAEDADLDRNCMPGEQRWKRSGRRDGHGWEESDGRRDGTGRREGGAGMGKGEGG